MRKILIAVRPRGRGRGRARVAGQHSVQQVSGEEECAAILGNERVVMANEFLTESHGTCLFRCSILLWYTFSILTYCVAVTATVMVAVTGTVTGTGTGTGTITGTVTALLGASYHPRLLLHC